jgi:hypothetical protein
MVAVVQSPDALKRLFSGIAEQTFATELGIADPPLIDYLSDMLLRFIRCDAIFKLRDVVGRRLEDVAEMLWEGEQRQGNAKREVFRHIGDFTLFWTGVYPEALRNLQGAAARDSLLDYTEQGKRSYRIAGEFDTDPYAEQAPVLLRLADEFELCSIGLRKVRAEWERRE